MCPFTKACGIRLPESPTASTRRRFGRTPMDRVGDRKQSAPSAWNTALGRMGQADDIRPVVAFLCSEAAACVNALRLEVSGGQMI